MGVLPTCMCVLTEARRLPHVLPDGVTGGCEPPYGCWEQNSSPFQEHQVLLTVEPPLQPQNIFFFIKTVRQWKMCSTNKTIYVFYTYIKGILHMKLLLSLNTWKYPFFVNTQ